MNDDLMEEWVQACLRTHTERKPTLLVLDSFRAHITTRIKTLLRKVNAVPAVIPGGCTSILQPLDVSINKPIKDQVRRFWEDYMYTIVEGNGPIKPPSKQQVVDWVAKAQENIRTDIITKSFKVTGISNRLDGSEDHLIKFASL